MVIGPVVPDPVDETPPTVDAFTFAPSADTTTTDLVLTVTIIDLT